MCGVEIPLLYTVSISNCRYQEAPGEVVWPGSTLRILDHPPRGLLSKNAKDALAITFMINLFDSLLQPDHILVTKFWDKT